LSGVRDPHELAQLRDRRCKRSADEMALALDGRYRLEHLTELEISLSMWRYHCVKIGDIDQVINRQLKIMKKSTTLPELAAKTRVRGKKPHDPGFDVRTALYLMCGVDLTAIEGIDEIHALTLISELGTDFSKWPTVKQFASWLGLCPNFKQSGKTLKSSKTRAGQGRAAGAFRLAAWSLLSSKSYLGSYLRGQKSRLGIQKAIVATAHKLARIVYSLMRYGVDYVKKAEADYTAQMQQRLEMQLKRRARQLGYELVPKADPPPIDPAVVS
jgi:transposase